jgi:DNA-directed RNA polymerase subunit RPC12/RpoP
MLLFLVLSYRAFCGMCGKETEHKGVHCTECGL